MPYSKEKVNVMNHLGMGLSVDNLCKTCEITYNDLCVLAQEYPDLMSELKKWYKRYTFTPEHKETKPVEDKSLETKEITEDKPKKAKKKVETK